MSKDPLASWSDRPAKASILAFVNRVTKKGAADFVSAAERIAVFDNDGTLWPEQPTVIQFAFAFDRVRALFPEHPEWGTTHPFRAVLEGEEAKVASNAEEITEIIAATHSGMTTTDFDKLVTAWLESTNHPRFEVRYTDLIYQPMIELLDYLRANEFKTFVVSGAGQDFVRVFAGKALGIPPEQVVGSTTATEFQARETGPVLVKSSRIESVEDGPGKVIAIDRFIGRRPIFAFGNSDGDKDMLEWTSSNEHCFIGMLHHTDEVREYAYDRNSEIGKLDRALDEARDKGWTVVDMKNDWRTIF